jgi:uncharacterized protein (TIGR02265 family)
MISNQDSKPVQSSPSSNSLEIQRLVFQSTCENLVDKAYGSHMNAGLYAELKAIGIDTNKWLPAYSHETFVAAIGLIAKHCHPDLPNDEAVRQIGIRTIETHFESALGKPLAALLRVLGPKRTLMRMTQKFRASNNYSETDVMELSPTHFHLWINDSSILKHSRLGLLQRATQLVFGMDAGTVEILSSDARGTVYSLQFQ